MTQAQAAETTARSYYDSEDADNFYSRVWGGEDIHVGLYETPDEEIAAASRRTVARMGEIAGITSGTRVLDLGSGYGGAARQLARNLGAHVHCLNLSPVENERNARLTKEQGLDGLVTVATGTFEDVPVEDASVDVVWSQDAFLHSGDRETVLGEVARVLKPGGQVVFTDPMAVDGLDQSSIQPILDRIQLATMATPGFYTEGLETRGFTSVTFHDHAAQLPTHYRRVREELVAREQELAAAISGTYIANMKAGLQHWVDGGNAGKLTWGVVHAVKG
ncbi:MULTISPECIES: methyltransferase domain-containing protein [unclassified Pseudonocardia]|uniref:methyltransferase domain-containing protein n=1 Tax=unclassified Pseudonocardia TaxID=2619320 RepID=UPI0001FFDCA3|nr:MULTISPECIES: methyltransferase domain-containing protein [unclassified Pseudonocardia]OLM16934.1 Dimethylglycine N-methyltransferase [Pseudonocardia sp. Ae707_Ps1]